MKYVMVLTLSSFLFLGCNNEKATEQKDESAMSSANEKKATQQAEFADAKYADIGKRGIAALSSGDIDGWMAGYADTATYRWNNGDSLIGKAAITEYWRKRRTEVIDSISFTNDIWIPMKVNKPQSVEEPGIWLLGWYQTDAKYKNGKRMRQWIHTDMHFNADDKIDRVIQYLDRASINAALAK